MNVLLDTHVLIWWVENSRRLGKQANELPRELEKSGFRPLAVNLDHALAVHALPVYHKDPFDRMLIVQARCEGLTLVTADPKISAYNVRTIDASA